MASALGSLVRLLNFLRQESPTSRFGLFYFNRKNSDCSFDSLRFFFLQKEELGGPFFFFKKKFMVKREENFIINFKQNNEQGRQALL